MSEIQIPEWLKDDEVSSQTTSSQQVPTYVRIIAGMIAGFVVVISFMFLARSCEPMEKTYFTPIYENNLCDQDTTVLYYEKDYKVIRTLKNGRGDFVIYDEKDNIIFPTTINLEGQEADPAGD